MKTVLREFFGEYSQAKFYNFQELDFAGFLGRLALSSYAPNEGQPRFEEMRKSLHALKRFA